MESCASASDRAREVLVCIGSLGWEGEVVVEIAVGGLGIHREAGSLRNGKRDIAVPVLDGDIAQRGSACDIHGAILVCNRDISGDAVERDIAVAGADRERANDFVSGQIGMVTDIGFSIQPDQLHIGTAGVEPDGTTDVFEVAGPKEIAVDADWAAEVG